jgi:hypothetical protein
MQGFQMQNQNTKNQSINGFKKRNCRLSRRPLIARSGITGGNVENKNESGEARDYGVCIGGRQGGVSWNTSDENGGIRKWNRNESSKKQENSRRK